MTISETLCRSKREARFISTCWQWWDSLAADINQMLVIASRMRLYCVVNAEEKWNTQIHLASNVARHSHFMWAFDQKQIIAERTDETKGKSELLSLIGTTRVSNFSDWPENNGNFYINIIYKLMDIISWEIARSSTYLRIQPIFGTRRDINVQRIISTDSLQSSFPR